MQYSLKDSNRSYNFGQNQINSSHSLNHSKKYNSERDFKNESNPDIFDDQRIQNLEAEVQKKIENIRKLEEKMRIN